MTNPEQTYDMKLEDLKLTCVKDPGVGGYTVWMDSFKGLIVQVEDLKDAPKQIAKSVEVMLMYGFDKNIHDIFEIDSSGNTSLKND